MVKYPWISQFPEALSMTQQSFFQRRLEPRAMARRLRGTLRSPKPLLGDPGSWGRCGLAKCWGNAWGKGAENGKQYETMLENMWDLLDRYWSQCRIYHAQMLFSGWDSSHRIIPKSGSFMVPRQIQGMEIFNFEHVFCQIWLDIYL